MKKSKVPAARAEPEMKALTVWGAAGVEVVGLQGGRPAARCRFGGAGAASFSGHPALTRAMVEAAIEAVRNGALGEVPTDCRVRLP